MPKTKTRVVEELDIEPVKGMFELTDLRVQGRALFSILEICGMQHTNTEKYFPFARTRIIVRERRIYPVENHLFTVPEIPDFKIDEEWDYRVSVTGFVVSFWLVEYAKPNVQVYITITQGQLDKLGSYFRVN
jgi:hypothetical protein